MQPAKRILCRRLILRTSVYLSILSLSFCAYYSPQGVVPELSGGLDHMALLRSIRIRMCLLILSMVLIGTLSGVWFLFHSTWSQQPARLTLSPVASTQGRAADPMALPYQRLATELAAHMTLDEKLGQLFMVGYDTPTYSPALERMLVDFHVGGVILYQVQIQTRAQTRHDTSEMQKHARIPLFIATDEEGGYVDRLANIYPPRPSALSLYRTGEPALAAQAGQQTAHDLQELGINENLAPDSDVQLVEGPNQLARTFGFTPQSVITFAAAYLHALQQSGIIGCIKHFPGLGAATTDAHLGLPIVRRTTSQLYASELAPFQVFVRAPSAQARPGMVMTTDVLMPAIDSKQPAELSHRFITDILRTQFGYDGVVITDSLTMQGITNHWTIPQAAVLAINAGNDMIIGITNRQQLAETIRELKAAIQHGTLTQDRLDASVIRILTLKAQYHLLPTH